MALFGSLLKGTAKFVGSAALGTARTGYRAALAPTMSSRLWNTGKMMGISGLAGGVIAGLQDDSNDPNLRLRNILGGAVYGAGITLGVAATLGVGRAGLRSLRHAAQMRGESSVMSASRAALFSAKKIYNTSKTLGQMGLNVASFAIQHPVGLAATGAGLYGLAYATRVAGPTSPTMRGARVNMQYDRQSVAAERMNELGLVPTGMVGTAPQMAEPMHRAFQNSTAGLVQGLNRGRHG